MLRLWILIFQSYVRLNFIKLSIKAQMGVLDYFPVQKIVYGQKIIWRETQRLKCVFIVFKVTVPCTEFVFLLFFYPFVTVFCSTLLWVAWLIHRGDVNEDDTEEKEIFPLTLSGCRKTFARELENLRTFPSSFCCWQIRDAGTGKQNSSACVYSHS